jgi:hypothetical protein
MKNLLRYLAFVLIVGGAYAQSNSPAQAIAFDFPTFNEKRTGIPIEVIAQDYGRLGDFNVLKTLGQECIDAIKFIPKRELNIAVIADSSTGSSVGVMFRDFDRFGKKYITKTFVCNFNKKLTEIVSVEK